MNYLITKTNYLMVLILSTSIFAGIINVPADIDSIQGGINLAVNGDTVLVADVYIMKILISREKQSP